MNLWLLTPTVFPAIRRALAAFVRAGPGPDDELLLPDVIGAAVARSAARVKVLDPGARWFGLTHAADKPAVMARLAELTAAGRYPSPLW